MTKGPSKLGYTKEVRIKDETVSALSWKMQRIREVKRELVTRKKNQEQTLS
jgi:hypothetical protein